MTNNTITNARPIHHIAAEIVEQCVQLRVVPSGYLVAYLRPLLVIPDLNEFYGCDPAVGIASYVLDALDNEPSWAGSAAERLTRELEARVTEVNRQVFETWGASDPFWS